MSNAHSIPRLLNIGCGSTFHEDWVNIDLSSSSSQVIQHDLLQGIPFAANEFDAVYHSHVLEHLTPQAAQQLISECFRVLKPEGILRIAVPDLEKIATLYLEAHSLALNGNESAQDQYDWMKLELLDQLVRQQSGGQMGAYICSATDQQKRLINSRLGMEVDQCRAAAELPAKSLRQKFSIRFVEAKQKLARRMIRILLGKSAKQAFDESLFRQTGEIHRWMYDRFSLQQLATNCGFVSAQVQSGFDSQIENFRNYDLDSLHKKIRKPDSLFMEFQKPPAAAQSNQAA